MSNKIDKDRLQMYISLTNITIVICWISLLSFWAIKLMGGNWFEVVVTNQNFIAFSNLMQNSWLKYLVSFLTICILRYFTFGAICQKFYFKGKQAIIVSLCVVSLWAVVNFVPLKYSSITSLYGYALFILISIIYQKGWKKLFGVFAIIFDFAFSSLSMMIRNIQLQVLTDYLLLLILCLDVYIMTALYYLYSNLIRLNKEKKLC